MPLHVEHVEAQRGCVGGELTLLVEFGTHGGKDLAEACPRRERGLGVICLGGLGGNDAAAPASAGDQHEPFGHGALFWPSPPPPEAPPPGSPGEVEGLGALDFIVGGSPLGSRQSSPDGARPMPEIDPADEADAMLVDELLHHEGEKGLWTLVTELFNNPTAPPPPPHRPSNGAAAAAKRETPRVAPPHLPDGEDALLSMRPTDLSPPPQRPRYELGGGAHGANGAPHANGHAANGHAAHNGWSAGLANGASDAPFGGVKTELGAAPGLMSNDLMSLYEDVKAVEMSADDVAASFSLPWQKGESKAPARNGVAR